jgi:LmbE family N-acetylglucosaminyl deacetylase
VQTTDGAPRDDSDARQAGCETRAAYAQLRRTERERAAALLGVPRARLRELGAADQEASLALAPLARRCASLLRAHGVEIVVTHPYEGGHPDHDATAFVVHAACALLDAAGTRAPVVLEMTSYHLAAGRLVSGAFLPNVGDPGVAVPLSAAEQEAKHRLYGCYASQGHVLEQFPIGEAERFRVAPRYDFTAPPHAGTLHYELYPWGMDGARWRALAATAWPAGESRRTQTRASCA